MRCSVFLAQHVVQKGLVADEPIDLNDAEDYGAGIGGSAEDGVRMFIPHTSIRYVIWHS